MRAIEFAKWFINGGYDVPRNTLEGNMRLQKVALFCSIDTYEIWQSII